MYIRRRGDIPKYMHPRTLGKYFVIIISFRARVPWCVRSTIGTAEWYGGTHRRACETAAKSSQTKQNAEIPKIFPSLWRRRRAITCNNYV